MGVLGDYVISYTGLMEHIDGVYVGLTAIDGGTKINSGKFL